MPSTLNFQARTSGGRTVGFAFPLHPDTKSADTVGALVNAILSGMDREARNHTGASSSDMVQALAIALAARAAMINAPSEKTGALAVDLLKGALAAASKTKQKKTSNGSAD